MAITILVTILIPSLLRFKITWLPNFSSRMKPCIGLLIITPLVKIRILIVMQSALRARRGEVVLGKVVMASIMRYTNSSKLWNNTSILLQRVVFSMTFLLLLNQI